MYDKNEAFSSSGVPVKRSAEPLPDVIRHVRRGRGRGGRRQQTRRGQGSYGKRSPQPEPRRRRRRG